MGGGLLLVGKATVCSLADEQTTAAERRMNEETVVFRRNLLRIYGNLLSSALAVCVFAPKGEFGKYGVN